MMRITLLTLLKVKRVVVPQALRVQKLRSDRDFTRLGKLAAEMGWKYSAVVEKLEEKRRIRGARFYQEKKALNQLKAKARAAAADKVAEHVEVLAKHGY
jgi:large subunit ribosomal protein L13Ae